VPKRTECLSIKILWYRWLGCQVNKNNSYCTVITAKWKPTWPTQQLKNSTIECSYHLFNISFLEVLGVELNVHTC
jgi:hypothetical protein